MKNILFPFIIIVSLPLTIFSQSCLPDGIYFTTQAQINSFQFDFPGCSEIEGDVLIIDNNITNLEGLNILTSIGGELIIYNTNLITLEGLDSLTSVIHGILIENNNSLIKLLGLGNLIRCSGPLQIKNNPALMSLAGINSDIIFGQLFLEDNETLPDLTGFPPCNELYSIYIGNNAALKHLYGLENLNLVEGGFTISDNSSLIDLQGLNNLSAVGGIGYAQGMQILKKPKS